MTTLTSTGPVLSFQIRTVKFGHCLPWKYPQTRPSPNYTMKDFLQKNHPLCYCFLNKPPPPSLIDPLIIPEHSGFQVFATKIKWKLILSYKIVISLFQANSISGESEIFKAKMLACERGKKLNEVEDKTEQLSNDAKVHTILNSWWDFKQNSSVKDVHINHSFNFSDFTGLFMLWIKTFFILNFYHFLCWI